ncbi:hypothetical protein [Stenotrophobium rhamnosiphilum]|uniref:hypothetical protein n=1 Tax=Stenotrophobium rhamnosiphilum TaxID=2029166 RepID=UPI000D3BCCB2|nr:hypothetical protein [Stenotrophobium rhamnosiphilum]
MTGFSIIKDNQDINDRAFTGLQFADEKLGDFERHGKNPEVFNFRIISENDAAIILMEFYGSSKAIVRLRRCQQVL